eukprot:755020-Hanusia_phi.AAC.2
MESRALPLSLRWNSKLDAPEMRVGSQRVNKRWVTRLNFVRVSLRMRQAHSPQFTSTCMSGVSSSLYCAFLKMDRQIAGPVPSLPSPSDITRARTVAMLNSE